MMPKNNQMVPRQIGNLLLVIQNRALMSVTSASTGARAHIQSGRAADLLS